MIRLPLSVRATLPVAAACAMFAGTAVGAETPPHLVLLNGRAVPLSAVALQGENFIVKTEAPGFSVGSTIAVAIVDHVYGDKPAAINQGVALLLLGDPDAAMKKLDPVLAAHKDTAKIPGSFWIEAARASVLARASALGNNPFGDIVKGISDATPAQGVDPVNGLARALGMSPSAKLNERVDAIGVHATPELPAEISAYASFFRADLLRKNKQEAEALEGYLTVSCLYPSGGMVITGMAQFRAAEILVAKGRRDEALLLAKSAQRYLKGTAGMDEVAKILESIK